MGSSHPQWSGSQRTGVRKTIASAAALQVHRGEEHLLTRELPPHTRLRVLETLRSRDPVVPEPPRVPAVGREGRSSWERAKGQRGRFGAGGMCYCEEGIVCPRGRKREVGPAPAGRCTAEFIQGEGSREGNQPRVLGGSISPHRLQSKVAPHRSALVGVGTEFHEPLNSCDARQSSPWSYSVLHRVYPISTAPQQPGRCLFPGRVQRLCVPVQTTRHSKREQWVCSGRSQRGKGHAQQSLPRPCSARTSQLPLPTPPSSAQAQGQGVGTSSAVDQRGLESCCFLRHKEKKIKC